MGVQKRVARATVYPVLALRGLVAFPQTTLHFEVAREKSVKALEAAVNHDQCLFLVSQKDMGIEDPTADDLNAVGVVVRIRQVLKMPSDTFRVAVEGLYRARIRDMLETEPHFMAEVKECLERPLTEPLLEKAFVRECRRRFEEYCRLSGESPEDRMSILSLRRAGELADRVMAALPAPAEEKQVILEAVSVETRMEKLLAMLTAEIDIIKLEQGIEQQVQQSMDKNQRDYYLHEQMKAIADELGESDSPMEEAQELREKIRSLNLAPEVAEKLLKECDRLSKMPFGSHEATVTRNYLDICLEFPWGRYSQENRDLAHASEILDRDHYGLKTVKERILELLAVRCLTEGAKGQVICLVGPPGVGKTSIARSIAESLGREYVRVSLGGVKDESEIRGHRKTYIGSMPGRIVTAMTKAKTMNPLLLLDEVDKLGNSYNGDPSSALLEVLDTEQNKAFVDHYMEVPVDLSQVWISTTANTAEDIPAPLFDRMDVITLSSYTAEEKFHIARHHLVKKQLAENGIAASKLSFRDEALRLMIDGYTREGGVRQLQRCIAKVCRKAAGGLVAGTAKRFTVTAKNLADYLGPRKFKEDADSMVDEIGVVNGLAWTAVGGETMPIEVAVLDGSGKLELTGSLGDVMKESARTAISYVRSRTDKWNIDKDFYRTKDIHIHVPEGAVPKDGPSAGVTMATAMISALTGIPVRHDVAMTGEISLRGKVLPIGGLKEKTMAAYRHRMKTVVIPKDNEADLADVDEAVKQHVRFVTARTVDTVVETALIKGGKANEDRIGSL